MFTNYSYNSLRLQHSYKLVFLSLFLPCILFAQSKADYQWILGGNASTLPNAEGTIFDFNGDSLQLSYQEIPISLVDQVGSICDENGQLLFYSNGCEIYDASFQVMENGDNINPGIIHDDYCDSGSYPGFQNSIVLPDPSNEYGYFYIHKLWDLVFDPFDIIIPKTFYSYISFQGHPLGRVLEKNITLDSNRYFLSSFIEAIQHQNGHDWWIVDFTEDTHGALAVFYLLDQNGIRLHHEYPVENVESLNERCSAGSQSCFSPDGTLLAKNCPLSGLDVWDFDRSTGNLSNYRHADYPSSYSFSGLSISPNSRFAYISASDSLFQVDLWEDNLEDGIVLIDTFDGFGDPFANTFFQQQLGPDCKIYMNSTNGVFHMHVINKPDLKGKDCDFKQHSISLPNVIYQAFPNFPYFRMDEDQVCDPSISSLFGIPVLTQQKATIFPNPGSNSFTIDALENTHYSLYVRSADGSLLKQAQFTNATRIQMETSDWEKGLYFLQLVNDNGESQFLKWVKH